MFRHAIATTRAERDPAGDLRGALPVPKAKHLSAITTPDGASELMRAIEGYTGHAITLFALQLIEQFGAGLQSISEAGVDRNWHACAADIGDGPQADATIINRFSDAIDTQGTLELW